MTRSEHWSLIGIILIGIGTGQEVIPPEIARDPNAFNRAVRLERSQRFEEAAEIYQALLKANPRNTRAYIQLKSLYRRLGKLNDLENLIRERLTLYPKDLQTAVELGDIFFLQGDEGKAFDHWDNVLAEYYHSRTVYRILMQVYVKHQLEERLDNLVQTGREVFRDPSLFSLDLGNIYAGKQAFGKAADEYITYAIYHPKQIGAVSTQVLKMSDRVGSQPIIEEQLKSRIPDGEEVVRTLYCEFLFKVGKYDDALAQHRALGMNTGNDFDRWLQFANNLRKENQLDLALDAFSELLKAIPAHFTAATAKRYQKLTGEALYGLALTYEKQIVPSKEFQSLADYFPNNVFFEDHFYGALTIQLHPLEETFALYDSILVSLPLTTFSPQAHFRLGEIKYRITQDLDGALESFKAAREMSKEPKLIRQATVRMGDVLIAKGDLSAAVAFFDEQIKRAQSDEDEEAYQLKKCQALFVSGEIDSTLFCLNNLIGFLDISDDDFNDALELKGFIEQNYSRATDEGKDAFRHYLQGESLLKQAKISEAQSIFAAVQSHYPESPVADDASFRRAKLDVLLGNYDAAISEFMLLQDTPLGDQATTMIGEIYDRYLSSKEQAEQWYLMVLEDYSDSMLAEPVRYRLRELSKPTVVN